jgi:YD repeat-containing protein
MISLQNYNDETVTDGNLIRTSTYPDGTTYIEKFNRDGSIAEISGTSVHTVRYEYGMENDEFYTKVITVGDSGSETQWVKTFTNFMGQQYKSVYPDSSQVVTYYDDFGRPVKRVGQTGIVTLTAYDTRGRVSAEAVDMDHDDVIDYDGTDIVSGYAYSVAEVGNLVFNVTVASSFMTNGSPVPTVVNTSSQAANGLVSSSTSFGRTTTSATSYNGNGAMSVTVTNPDTSTVTSVYQDGRLVSSTHSVLGATTYAYDQFGRTSSVTNPMSQTTSYTYDNAGRPLTVTDNLSRTTTYVYDSMGRRTSATLPGGRTVYSRYWPTGELKEQFGSETYPQRYSYDAAGRMKTLTTYKSFNPNSPNSGESTTWAYDTQRGFMTISL